MAQTDRQGSLPRSIGVHDQFANVSGPQGRQDDQGMQHPVSEWQSVNQEVYRWISSALALSANSEMDVTVDDS